MGKSKSKEKLEALIERVEYLLKAKGQYFTDGAKLAIADIVKDAILALEENYKIPFIRNREFYKPREEEYILFTTKRFTMAPTYNLENEVYHYYGLEPALEWFEKQNVLYDGKEALLEKADFVIKKAQELLNNSITGKEMGNYNSEAAKKLEAAIKKVKIAKDSMNNDSNGEELGRAIIYCFNKIREYRYSRVLRTDVDQSTTLYLTKENLKEIKKNVDKDPLIKKQYEKIKEISDIYSIDYIEKAVDFIMNENADYDKINKEFYVWSFTDKIINFKAPENAVKANISFILPCEENEQEGLGHVWIDNLEISSANGESLEILNSGFDEGVDKPLHWTKEILKGNPTIEWEGNYPYSSGGKPNVISVNPAPKLESYYKEDNSKHSIYLCNPTNKDEGAWTYDKEISVESNVIYTLSFFAKIDGKFKKGVKIVISYKDKDGDIIENYEYYFNRKSSLGNGCFGLTMQCDAIQYAFTKDITYALKTKNEILFTLNDFCQGAEYWLVTNSRPEGSDCYGAVQGGRILSVVASSYSLIKEADVFSKEEKEKFYGMIEYLLRYMMDLRDRTELSPTDAQYGCTNWQTDMSSGTGFIMAVLDDFPNRKTWLYNANMVLKSQLKENVNSDGSWPESIRYHHAALERFASYAKMLENLMGDNWFVTTPISKMFGYSLNMQTPAYEFFDGHIGTPPFGDHALGDGKEFGIYGIYLGDIEKIDKNLSDRMYHTWKASGKPFKGFSGESVAIENILGKGDTYKPSGKFELTSCKDFADAGIYVFRKNFGSVDQSYFAIMSSPKPVGHGHLDQGSFVIYKNSIPIVMDSGIEGYFNSSTSWHLCSYSHACMQFSTKKTNIEKSNSVNINLSAGTYSLERGFVDVPKTSNVLEYKLGDEIETITIEIMNPEGNGKHMRKVYYVKEPDLYIIHDKVKDFDGEVLFNLPIAARNSIVEGNKVYSNGVYNIDLETVFLSELNSIQIDKGRSTVFFDSENDTCMMDYIRAKADAKTGFLTLIYPKERDKKKLDIVSEGKVTVISLEGKKLKLITNKDGISISII